MDREVGWVKLHRKMVRNWKKPFDVDKAWLWLILMADYEGESKGRLFTTYSDLAHHWGISRAGVQKRIAKFVDNNQVECQGIGKLQANFDAKKVTLLDTVKVTDQRRNFLQITIVNWDRYQGESNDELRKGSASGSASGSKSSDIPFPEEKEKKKNTEKREGVQNATPRMVQKAPAASAGTVKKTNDKKPPNPDHKRVVAAFHEYYLQIYGKKYVWQTKDFVSISRWLEELDPDELIARLQNYLDDDDHFLVKNGHSIALFHTRINAYDGRPAHDYDSEWPDLKLPERL